MIDQKLLKEYQRKKCANYIREIDSLWGGNDEKFLNEYIADILHTCEDQLVEVLNTLKELKETTLRYGTI